MTRVAAVDCGTNSIRLLIAERGGDGSLAEVAREVEIVRLGQGVDATGEFHPDALLRTFAVVDHYAELIRSADVPPALTRFVATSAARDARNREELSHGIESRLGVVPQVITGDEEARLSFSGALSRSRVGGEPVLVMDIGGGSTELVVGSASGQLAAGVSIDIGSVRLTERFLPTSPPAADDLARAARYVDEQLAQSEVDLSSVRTWIGVAGTVTTLAAVVLGLTSYDRARVHGAVITRVELDGLLARLSALTVEEIRALPAMHPGRADVITAGTLIAARVAALSSAAELVVSESDILDGIALDLLQREGSRP